MDRRSFFRSMIGGVAANAAVRTWPFRVYSFSSNIVSDPQRIYDFMVTSEIEALDAQYREGILGKVYEFDWWYEEIPVGSILTIPSRLIINPEH